MYNSNNYEFLKPYVGQLLQLPDEEKIDFISKNWSSLKDYIYAIDQLLLHAQRGQNLSDIASLNVWRRLLLNAKI